MNVFLGRQRGLKGRKGQSLRRLGLIVYGPLEMTRLGQTTPLEEILVHAFSAVLDVSVNAEAPEQRMFDAVRLNRVGTGCVLVHSLSCLCAWVAVQNVEVRRCNRVRARGALECRAVICGFDCVISHGEIVGFTSMSSRNQGH